MIPHRKRPAFNRVFVAYAKWLLRGHFDAVRVQGMEHLGAALAQGPVIVVANHTAWWDAIVLMWLSNYPLARVGPSDGYALMDAKNLRKLGFFRYLGVFGVDLTDPDDRAAVVPYAASLLTAPGRSVWLFPQGAERPITERPLGFHPGAARLAQATGAPVVAMAIRYEHGRQPRPTCYLDFSPPLTGDNAGLDGQESAIEAGLDRIEAVVRAAARGPDPMGVALRGRSNPFASAFQWILARFTSRRRPR